MKLNLPRQIQGRNSDNKHGTAGARADGMSSLHTISLRAGQCKCGNFLTALPSDEDYRSIRKAISTADTVNKIVLLKLALHDLGL